MPFDYTGSFSGSFYGDIASTNGVLSSSAQVISSLPDGVVSASTQINYIDLQNKPVTISAFQKNSIVANTNFRQSTFPPISESFDSRITILTSDVSTLSGQIQAAVSGTVPPGTISGSVQITEFGYLTSASAAAAGFGSGGGSSTDISALNTFTASIQSEVNTLTAVTSSYLTSVPSGTISGSSQITITESQISDLGSYLVSVPVGTISSSAQIAGLGYLTSETDSQTLTYVGDTLTISNGNSVTIPTGSNLPAGVISGSSQITITESQISDLGSYLTSVPAGTVSGSSQITSVITDTYISASAALSGFGAGGGSSTDISALNTFTASIQTDITALDARIDALSVGSGSADWATITNIPSGLVSGSSQITNVVTDTYISASAAASGFGQGGSSTDISALNTFTGSIQSEVDSLTAATSSYLTSLPSGVVSGSTQITDVVTDSYISASAAASGFGAGGGEITYISESGNLSLSQIEVADFDDNVAVTFTGGKLKFIFGSPTVPSSLNSTLSGFATNRFNKVTDGYNANGSWNNGGYTLISASLFEGATLLTQVGSGTSLSYSTTTSGSHTYKLEYTASSPLDGTIYTSSDTVSGTLSKSNPGNPSISATPSVQLGASSNQIEQGATGSITFSVSYGSSNSWEQVLLSSTPTSSPIYVTGSVTGSSSIVIGATAEYQSPAGDNDPQISSTRTNSTTYSKIRSVRYGGAAATSFTQSELEDLSSWDTSLGGSIGTIDKGNTTPSGDTITITWTGNKYHYIVFDSSRSDLTNITTSGFGVFASFTKSVVGNYKVYRSNDLQSDSGGGSITYVLT
jgi:trimeric autotransporter adhesin